MVQPGDTLWRIAAEQLGDGADWTSLARLNLGRDLGGGAHFVDPDQLREGWRLRLPTDARRSADGDSDGDGDLGHRSTSPGHLPELVALGLGSVACAALARRARRRRRLGARFSAEPLLQPALSEGAQDAATLLQRFDGVPALRALEAANSLLGLALEGRPLRPKVRAICVSPSGVTFCFADAQAGEPPHGFSRAKMVPPGMSATTRSRATTPAFPISLSCFLSATTTREPGSSRSSRVTCCPCSARRRLRSGAPHGARSDRGPGPRPCSSPRIPTTRRCAPRPSPTLRSLGTCSSVATRLPFAQKPSVAARWSRWNRLRPAT